MENSYEDTQEMFESGNDEDENKSPLNRCYHTVRQYWKNWRNKIRCWNI